MSEKKIIAIDAEVLEGMKDIKNFPFYDLGSNCDNNAYIGFCRAIDKIKSAGVEVDAEMMLSVLCKDCPLRLLHGQTCKDFHRCGKDVQTLLSLLAGGKE